MDLFFGYTQKFEGAKPEQFCVNLAQLLIKVKAWIKIVLKRHIYVLEKHKIQINYCAFLITHKLSRLELLRVVFK